MSIKPLSGLLIVILCALLPIFSHLDDAPIQLWDEGRLANNALEMYETGDPLVVTYGYKPEMWNTKPPLMIWLQVLSLKIFGISDLAIRLPSALAALFTCIFLYWFFTWKLKAPWIGIISTIILLTCPGYVRLHGIRTGDYDAVLVLFTTLYCIYFYLFVEEWNKKYFWLTIMFLISAALTKGIAGLLFIPPLFLYSLLKGKLLPMLRMPQLYVGVLAFLVLVLGYYLLREQYNPGYIAAVVENEITGRYGSVIEGHKGDDLYYYNYLIDNGFKPWHLLYVMGLALGLVSIDKQIRDYTIFSLCCVVLYLVSISMAKTKLEWYTQPLYPFLASNVAIFFYIICQAIFHSGFMKNISRYDILPYLFVFIMCVVPYKEMFNTLLKWRNDYNKADDVAVVLKSFMKGKYPYDQPMKVILQEYQSGVEWYLKALKHKNVPVGQSEHTGMITHEELVIAYQDDVKTFIEQNYSSHVVDAKGTATIYQVHGEKPDSTISNKSRF